MLPAAQVLERKVRYVSNVHLLGKLRAVSKACFVSLLVVSLVSVITYSWVGYQTPTGSIGIAHGSIVYSGGTLLEPGFPPGWHYEVLGGIRVNWRPRWHFEPGWTVKVLPLWMPLALIGVIAYTLRRLEQQM